MACTCGVLKPVQITKYSRERADSAEIENGNAAGFFFLRRFHCELHALWKGVLDSLV